MARKSPLLGRPQLQLSCCHQSFNCLPDVSRIEFHEAAPQPLHLALPHLPSPADESPASLIDGFLAYPPSSRLAATQALLHPWFSIDLLLPTCHFTHGNTAHDKRKNWLTEWRGRTLADWLEPALVREASRVTRNSP